MFEELLKKSKAIIYESRTYKMATKRISEMVSSKVSAESEGYIIDMYFSLTEKIKKEDYFKNPEHLNAFYRLNLREKMDQKYHFEVTSLEAYKKGIEFHEMSRLYSTLGTTAGTLAVGGILKFAISGVINIPIAVIIAAAVAVGLATYFTIPEKNKHYFYREVENFLNDMESEIMDWLEAIENYFDEQVRGLYQI